MGEQKLIDLIDEFAERSTHHGISKIAIANFKITKLAWLILTLVSSGYCSYLIGQNILSYLHRDVSSYIQTITKYPVRFPAVDVCNIIPYQGELVRKLVDESLAKMNISEDIEENELLGKFRLDHIINDVTANIEIEHDMGNIDMHDIGFKLSELLESCTFQSEVCDEKDFIRYHSYKYGNCYRFNANETQPKMSTEPGAKLGLQLQFDIGAKDNEYHMISYSKGMRVLVHHVDDDQVFPEEDGIDVSAGYLTNIGFHKKRTHKLSAPYSKCIIDLDEETDKHNDILASMRHNFSHLHYSQKLCLKLCLQKYISSNCECYDYKLPTSDETYTGCRRENQTECTAIMERNFFNTDSLMLESLDNCPEVCDTTEYEKDISISVYPSRSYIRELIAKGNETVYREIFERYRGSHLAINFYYSKLTEVATQEVPTLTELDILSNIGGTLGLFMGTSFLSFGELIELFILIVYRYLKNCSKKKKRNGKTKVVDFNS